MRSWILPQHYGVLIQSQLERCQLLRAWVAEDPTRASSDLYQPEEPLEELSMRRWKLTFLLSAGARALENVSMSATYLAHAEQRGVAELLKAQAIRCADGDSA